MLKLCAARGPACPSVFWMVWVHFPREINLVTLPAIEAMLAYVQQN